MGRRPLMVVVLAAALYGGYWFLQRFQIDGLDKISVRPRAPAPHRDPAVKVTPRHPCAMPLR